MSWRRTWARVQRAGQVLAAERRRASVAFDEYGYDRHTSLREESHDRKVFLRRAFQTLAYNGIAGDYAEFGCFGARTFRHAWDAAELIGYRTHLWAFDSFEGLPASTDPRDAHPGWDQGEMAMSEPDFIARCVAHGIPRDRFSTVKGFYADSLPVQQMPDRVSFAYVDCDLYSSTTEVLRFLEPRIQHGTIVAFDDYYCYSPHGPSGERLAAAEFFDDNPDWQLLPYVQYGWYGKSFVVERRWQ